LNRITAPFFKSEFKEDIIGISKEFKEGVHLNLTDKFKVNKVVLGQLPELNYAFVEVKKVSVFNKAEQMMKHNYELIHQVDELKIPRTGFPFVIVTDWDIDKNEIDYRLCIEIDSIVKHTIRGTLKFDQLAAQPSLKTIYNGNYIYSDKAWFALHDFALRKNYDVNLKPIEFFHNNPFTDTKEIEWVTEVFLPLSQ
jgi:effector-binding domain-containing protein